MRFNFGNFFNHLKRRVIPINFLGHYSRKIWIDFSWFYEDSSKLISDLYLIISCFFIIIKTNWIHKERNKISKIELKHFDLIFSYFIKKSMKYIYLDIYLLNFIDWLIWFKQSRS